MGEQTDGFDGLSASQPSVRGTVGVSGELVRLGQSRGRRSGGRDDAGHRRREGTKREAGEPVATSEQVRRLAKGSGELPVLSAEHEADGLGRSMNRRRCRAVAMQRFLVGMLSEDRPPAKYRSAVASALAVECGPLSRPARNRCEDDLLCLREFGGWPSLSPATRLVFRCAIEPGALERDAVEKRLRAVDAGPVLRSGDEAFFHAVAEKVGETPDLGLLLVGNDEHGTFDEPDLHWTPGAGRHLAKVLGGQ